MMGGIWMKRREYKREGGKRREMRDVTTGIWMKRRRDKGNGNRVMEEEGAGG